MKNFPSALIKQKTTKQGLGDKLSTTFTNVGSKILKNIFSKGNPGSDLSIDGLNEKFNTGYEILDIEHELDNININKNHKSLSKLNNGDIDEIIKKYNHNINFFDNTWNGIIPDSIVFEDPFVFSSSIFSVINNYKYVLKSTVPNVLEHPKPQNQSEEDIKNKKDPNYEMATIHHVVAPSLFNPYAGVSVVGITEHIPLVITGNNFLSGEREFDNGFYTTTKKTENGKEIEETTGGPPQDTTLTPEEDQEKPTHSISLDSTMFSLDKSDDCTIKTLVEESNKGKDGNLGLATYRYIDFMFCKDLGKISNNHLITLRKFPGPIGDNIFKEAYPYIEKGEKNEHPSMAYPDIGRLITWFGNEDNKLEDICKFNYNATWKEFHAEIQQERSQQQDTGILDEIANTFSPQNNRLVSKGFSSHTGLLKHVASAIKIPIIKNDRMNNATYNWDLLSNYDKNKIYTPTDTIWDTHKYEGKLTFNQEITLTFRYVMRSYSNINPKSAFLDLIANILTVTYRRGSFWGGETKIYGPQGNNSVYRTADAFIDQTWDKLGGIWTNIMNGSFNLQSIQGWISNTLNATKDMGKDVLDNTKKLVSGGPEGDQKRKSTAEKVEEKTQEGMKKAAELNKKYGWTDALKGMLKNQLGRPAMYATNSLLSGEPVGPWHLTIGNPKNPIMSMGNMIITGSELQHSGPLGLDDFPTELKLVVTLKHGRPRDSIEIQKMYTKGRSSIYKPMNMMQLSKYKNNPHAFGDVMKYDELKTITYKGEDREEDVLDKNGKPVMEIDPNDPSKKTKRVKKRTIKGEDKNLHDEVLAKVLRNI